VAGLQHHQGPGAELGDVHGDVAPQQLANHARPVVAQHHAARVDVGCKTGRQEEAGSSSLAVVVGRGGGCGRNMGGSRLQR
jgi:hypothetical protein